MSVSLIDSWFQALIFPAIFFSGLLLNVALSRKFSVSQGRSIFIYCWHSFFCVIYIFYTLNNPADSLRYYTDSVAFRGVPGFGTSFVIWFTSLFSKILGLGYLGSFLVFNIFGSIGLIAVFGALKQATKDRKIWVRRAAFLIVLLPSISFWSSAIGKDSIAFMAVGLALWSALDLSKRGGLMAFSVFAMLLVRPHIAGVMLIALMFAALVDGKIPLIKKFFLLSASIAAAVVLIPFALKYAGLKDFVSVEEISAFVDQRQAYNTDGGGGLDIASMSLPMQLFTYMFRPMLFEAKGLFSLAAAVDNLILLIVFLFGGMSFIRGRKSRLGENRIFMWAYVLGSWLILAMTTANLGIALRQKWMLAPMIIFLLMSVIGRRQCMPNEVYDQRNSLKPLSKPERLKGLNQ